MASTGLTTYRDSVRDCITMSDISDLWIIYLEQLSDAYRY